MFNSKEYVLCAYKHKSFSKAANELKISQPSLSASIKRIENEIGYPIFDRSTSPLSLTEVGMKYISCALEISAIEKNFKNYLNDNTENVMGKINIGGSSMFLSFVLPNLISEFNKSYPKVEFNIFEDYPQDLTKMLIDGKIDIYIDNVLLQGKSLEKQVLTTELMMLAVPAGFAVNKKLKGRYFTADDIRSNKHKSPDAPTVSLSEFKDEPFIILKPENDTGKRALKLFKKCGITPKIIFKLDQQITSYNITNSGVGLSFISDTLIANNNGEDGVCYYKLDDEEITRNIYLYTKANRYLTKACNAFMDISLKNE